MDIGQGNERGKKQAMYNFWQVLQWLPLLKDPQMQIMTKS